MRTILKRAVELNASDIHLKPDRAPFFRINGQLMAGDLPVIPAGDLGVLLEKIVPGHLKGTAEPLHEMDFSYVEENIGRFRVNAFISRGLPALTFRYVKERIPSLEELHLPPVLKKLAQADSGMIMVCGATSTGKSTTLAALVDLINKNQCCRIITVEDPVEYVFKDEKSFITQREVGLDTVSFHAALKHVVREDPDVIVIGEMRDHISFSVALSAADTGHLVLSTLHVNSAAYAVHRVLDFFPHAERDQVRITLANYLVAALCQRIVPAAAGGILPVVEIMINTPTVRKLIMENQLDTLPAAIETGNEEGMQTFNQVLYGLVRGGEITEEVALANSPRPEALRMNLQGIFLDEGKRILG
ncbi:MAG: PilT/PilU family type 4a pilus ATPase [Kiritimatiellae bacterium]|nr:PilT/PilU family type 4a pilus ATPase [Kiritimatiellia bacterium]